MEHETKEVGAPAVTPGRATLVQTAPDNSLGVSVCLDSSSQSEDTELVGQQLKVGTASFVCARPICERAVYRRLHLENDRTAASVFWEWAGVLVPVVVSSFSAALRLKVVCIRWL